MSIDRIARRPTVVITPMVTAPPHIPRPDDPGEAVRYQRQRLAVGVVGIGLLVVGTPLLATTDAARSAARDLSVGPAPVGGALVAAALAVLASLILLPVDWAGGVAVERRFGMGGDGCWRSFLPVWRAGSPPAPPAGSSWVRRPSPVEPGGRWPRGS